MLAHRRARRNARSGDLAAAHVWAPGMNPRLLGAAGRGEIQPAAGNDTPAGRVDHRRIEIRPAAPLSAASVGRLK